MRSALALGLLLSGRPAHTAPGQAPLTPAATPAALPPAAAPEPLPAATAALWQALPEDPPPSALIRNSHYVTSNEDHLELFRDALRPLGGVYIGVGSEQNYLLAGWTRPELLVLMDFDGMIADLHRVYRVAFLNAATPDEFLRLWDDASEAHVQGLIDAAYQGKQAKAAQRAFKVARHAVRARLARLVRLFHKTPMFLNDAGQYGAIQALFRTNRVVMLRGDLTADQTVQAIGAAAHKSGLPVRVLYLSNAERYFNYEAGFKRNMQSLPMDDSSLVLRTSARKIGQYQYTVQSGLGFQAWLRRRGIVRVWNFLNMREPGAQEGAWIIKALPVEKAPGGRSAQN